MSSLDLLEAEELVSEPVSDEPPKRWVNWWRANVRQFSQVLDADGRETDEECIREAGDEWPAFAVFNTKAEAESRAAWILADAADEATVFDCPPLLTYLGAYPQGERP